MKASPRTCATDRPAARTRAYRIAAGRTGGPGRRTGTPARLVVILAAALAAAPSPGQTVNVIWLAETSDHGGLFEINNPDVRARVGRPVDLYIWISKTFVTAGYDGISLDVQVLSDDGGRVTAGIAIENDDERWFATYGGTPLPGSGGTGIDNANAIDLTNTDTIAADPFCFARLTLEPLEPGTVRVFLGIGDKGIADDGTVRLFQIGMADGVPVPEARTILGSAYGATSDVPEAILRIADAYGDYDSDRDVDIEDFARFQACFNGAGQAAPPGCANADADGDGDVDVNDFAVFQACFNGPGHPPAPLCP